MAYGVHVSAVAACACNDYCKKTNELATCASHWDVGLQKWEFKLLIQKYLVCTDDDATAEDDDVDELASEEAAPEQEQILQAAGLLEENDLSGEAGKQESAEEASAQARALEERDRNARPPWFSPQRTLTADPVRKDNHG